MYSHAIFRIDIYILLPHVPSLNPEACIMYTINARVVKQ